ncbi:MAG: TonB-dependent receptor [Solitalea sp.]
MRTIVLRRLGSISLMLVLACLFRPSFLWAQQAVTVSGTVSSSDGQGLPGVSILLKGTQAGTMTEIDGSYSLNLPAEAPGDTLIFSLIGYRTLEIAVSGRSRIDVTLQEDLEQLEEVVVVGYGTQQKRDLTSAISVVKAEDLQQRQATTVAEALQGLASGVTVRAGGRPGGEGRIEIRGLKNLQSANPLYVIDGLVTTANRDFNPNDIESIQILKDASAAAIYGSRAANGVIIITTKKGREGPMRVEFSAKSSLQTIPRYDLADTEEFARLNNMAYDNAGKPRQNLDLSVNTDWQDVTFQTGNMQDYNLSFSGGNESGSYYVSGNYFGNKGTVIDTRMDRLTFRVNTEARRGIFSIGENLEISNTQVDEMFDAFPGSPLFGVFRMLPTIPVYDDSNPGGYGYGDEDKARTFGTNPVARANLEHEDNENFRVRGNLWSELQLLPSLRYRLNLGYETSSDHRTYLREEGSWTLNQPLDPALANENRARSENKLIENTLTFSRTFDRHELSVVAGQTYQREDYQQIWGSKRNLLRNPNGGYYSVLDQGNEPQTGGFENTRILLSYLARLEYNFDNRYLLNAIIRRDGSSRLGSDYKWGNFPSVSAAWRISQEDFFDVPWISDLKLRASYGRLGSGNIGPYDYIPVINTFSTIAIGSDQHTEQGAIQVNLANQDLRWETLTQQNIGVDATFLNGELTLAAEYFNAETKDVLFRYPILLTSGTSESPIVNGVTLRNTGFEFSLTYQEAQKPVNYYVTANVSTLSNKVVRLGYDLNRHIDGNTITELGQPVGMWYVLETDGLFQSEAEIAGYTNADGKIIQPDAQPGDIRFKDHNGDGQITNDDKVVVGSPWADVEIGLNMGVSYKQFELSMNWFSALGATVYNGPRSIMDRFDDNSNYRSGITPWTPENPNVDFPRVVYASTLNARGDTDRWLENGSFLRLKYISLSYELPQDLVSRIGFSQARISLSAQNLLTFTSYLGLDPEFNNSYIFHRGVDFGSFPNLKTYSLGLQFGF